MWLDTAFSALAEGGIDLVRVEALAKRLSVTKGGFYWHFRDRSELISTLLDRWRQGRIEAIVAQTRREGQPALNRLNGLLSLYLENANPRGAAIELAVRDWARRDGEAAAAVAAVDLERLRCVSELFAALNVGPDEAFARAFLFYSFIFGQSLLVCDRTDPTFIRARDICARLLVE